MDDFIAWARRHDWQVELSEEARELSPEAFRRYGEVPAGYRRFLQHVIVLSNRADTGWFLSADHFTGAAPAWQADSFEQISLEAAGGDQRWREDILGFWDGHMPIVFSLARGYEYYAICIRDGTVVNGTEPEFEEVSPAAASLEEFLAKIMAGVITL